MIYRFPKVVQLVRDKHVKMFLGPCKIIVTQSNRMVLVSPEFGRGLWGTFQEWPQERFGVFSPNKTFFALPQQEAKDMLNRIELVELNGLAAVKEIGLLTGSCCICGKTLTNEDSIADGIGPICSGKVGGMW